MAAFVELERTKAKKKSQKETVTLYFSVSARETLLRCTYRDFHRAHCSLSSHTNPTNYIIDTSNSQCQPLSPHRPIRMQFMSEKAGLHGEVGWERRVYCCRNCAVPVSTSSLRADHRGGLRAHFPAEGGRAIQRSSEAGSHLSYWQCRRHQEFNNTSGVHYWHSLITVQWAQNLPSQ